MPNGYAFDNPRFVANRSSIDIGQFRVTPYLVDHSAFDAYALLIEADGGHRRATYGRHHHRTNRDGRGNMGSE